MVCTSLIAAQTSGWNSCVNPVGRHQPLPEGVVLLHVIVGAEVVDGAVVAPRIAAVQLVAAGPREHDLDELAGQPRHVEIRIALADAQVLLMPDQVRHHPLHVAGLQHHLVVLGLELIGQRLGASPLVEVHLETRRR